MKVLAKILLVSCLCLVTLVSANDWSAEGRVGIGGLYGKRDLAPMSDATNSGGYLSFYASETYKRFKFSVVFDLGAGNSSRINEPFYFYDTMLKFGLNLASYDNPLFVYVGTATDRYYDDTGSNAFKINTLGLLAGVEGSIKSGERLRYEYGVDYNYIGGRYNGVKFGYGDGYGIRASLGFSYQLKEKLFYYVKLRAKYQNITYNPTLPTANNLIGMVEIGIGGR